MKRVKGQQRAAEAGNGKQPKWWKKDIVAPILVGIILSFVGFGIWFMQRSFEQKAGELQVICNVDSAKVLVNHEFKVLTQAGAFVSVASLQPGDYLLSIKKTGFDSVDTKVKISIGEIASIKIDLKLLQAEGDTLVGMPELVADSVKTKPAVATKFYPVTIAVHSKLKNAKIMIDGKWKANAPNTVSLSAGRHLLRVENETYFYEEMLQVPSRALVNVTEDEMGVNSNLRNSPAGSLIRRP